MVAYEVVRCYALHHARHYTRDMLKKALSFSVYTNALPQSSRRISCLPTAPAFLGQLTVPHTPRDSMLDVDTAQCFDTYLAHA
jgi:hypothetical protein